MQTPTYVFDHINNQVLIVAGGPETEKRLAEIVEQSRTQVVSSGRPRPA